LRLFIAATNFIIGRLRKSAGCPRLCSPAKPFLPKRVFSRKECQRTSRTVYEFVETGAAEIAFDLKVEFEAVKNLAVRYQNVPMSLADACLVRMSEIYENSIVFTTDGDFRIYPKNSNQIIPTIMPKGF